VSGPCQIGAVPLGAASMLPVPAWHHPMVDIRRITDAAAVEAAGQLFDHPPIPAATSRFLAESGHHLLLAYVDDHPVGMVTGVETTHPDKGTEMFLYELGVDERFQRRGIGRALVATLARLARERGCYGMWVATEAANAAAVATYRQEGVRMDTDQVIFSWDFGER